MWIESGMLNMSFNRLVGGNTRESVKRIEMKNGLSRGKSHIVPENYDSQSLIKCSKWDNLPGELLVDIIQRVEGDETSWPARRDMVSCAAVCTSWRDTVKQIVKTPEQCGLLTFPMSLKQPGPRKEPIQCFIRRDRATSTFRLYLGLSPALAGDASKLLLAAKKVRKTMRTDFSISLTSDGFSRASNTYVGKISSNFLGTKFSVYDAQPCYYLEMNPIPNFCLKKVSPGATSHVVKSKVAIISYELNVLRTKGPRRLHCTINSNLEPQLKSSTEKNQVILRNKVPRWHEQLQCWCLNFKGRVTVASVKNFQLAVDQTREDGDNDDDVILQFGKIGKDIFTMDYRYPLSAFQAFAVCLSSFDTKPACE